MAGTANGVAVRPAPLPQSGRDAMHSEPRNCDHAGPNFRVLLLLLGIAGLAMLMAAGLKPLLS
jgi:hypothetical protein